MKSRGWLWFLAANAVLALVVFRGALWGDRLLAPLDIAPALFAKYRWLDPQNPGVPANHYTIDQLTYDLPLQRTIHQAYRRGETPWWDPYTFAGRPLLADAHVNGTDPVRLLCYRLLPFELAYNWTLILHWFLSGLGVFVLLRAWRIRVEVAIGLALAFECSGYAAVMFGHPWNMAAFLFYPWLWLAWDAWQVRRTWWSWPLGTLAMAGVFYAGNLQSHAYAAIFAAVYLVSYGGCSLAAWRRALPIVAGCGVLGAALAAPVLAGQLEFYHLSVRAVPLVFKPLTWLSGVASLSAVFPWALGSFRTLDLSKFTGQYALGFVVYLGSAAAVLAALGAWHGRPIAPRPQVHRCAGFLVLAYVGILSTPLQAVLYTRSAGLAMLGLVVLAGFGIESLWQSRAPLRRWGWAIAGLTLGLMLALNLAAFMVYPRVLPRVKQILGARAEGQGRTSLDAAPALREFQVGNLAAEISIRNPETVLAGGSLLLLAGLCLRPRARESRWALLALLGLNLAPALLFFSRFIPNQPVSQWHRLLEGGPPQRPFAALLGGTPGRLEDVAPGIHDQVFPNGLAHLYGVRTVHGYSALLPASLGNLPADEQARWRDFLADVSVTTVTRGDAMGVVRTNQGGRPVNFQWRGSSPRSFKPELVSLNVQRVALEAGAAGTLLWTDTAYPGWRATLDGQPATLRRVPPTFSEIEVPAGGRMELLLAYRPKGLRLGQALAALALLALVTLTLYHRRSAFR